MLDSDTLVLREPEAFLLPRDVDVAVRPVDCQGDVHDRSQMILTTGTGVGCARLRRSSTTTSRGSSRTSTTSVARRATTAGWSWCGAIAASCAAGRTSSWPPSAPGLQPHAEAVAIRSSTGEVAAAASRMWGSNQAALSLAIWSTTRRVLTLEPTYNYPLHYHEALGERGVKDFDRLVHVHYHWLFEPDAIAHSPLRRRRARSARTRSHGFAPARPSFAHGPARRSQRVPVSERRLHARDGSNPWRDGTDVPSVSLVAASAFSTTRSVRCWPLGW